jgi:hypothetical protein
MFKQKVILAILSSVCSKDIAMQKTGNEMWITNNSILRFFTFCFKRKKSRNLPKINMKEGKIIIFKRVLFYIK